MKNYTARVTRDGRFWLVHIPKIDRYTQARNLREIDVMARDLVAIMEGIEPDSFELTVDITMPGAAAEHLRRAEHLRAEAAKSQSERMTPPTGTSTWTTPTSTMARRSRLRSLDR